jgi:predicted regulator of Ras-like GTPase activity (Roadblock/LC7/MglB family)
MDKKVLEQKMSELMDLVPECEGLIASDLSGNVLIGQTITDMDHKLLAKDCIAIVKGSKSLGENLGKGKIKTTTIDYDNGFAVVSSSDELIIIALAGLDGKASLSLIKRNLIKISNM